MRLDGKTIKKFVNCPAIIIAMGIFLMILLHANTVYASQPIAINDSNFPDPIFRSVISSTYDYNGNGYIEQDEIEMTMNIVCEGKGVSSVKGIEFFTEIQGLWVMDNDISSLDVSKNVHLHGIWCSGNPISFIDLSHNPELEWIYCYDCKLTSLDVSHNPDMAFIECNTNPITSLDLSNNPKMEHLTCGSCELTTLDLSNCPNLAHLDAFRNHFTSLDVTHNPKLKRLDIWDNPGLGSIDISQNAGLQYYNCAHNDATSVDVSHNPELTKLICSYNHSIKEIDVSNNPKLAYLDCAVNEISSLDLSNNPRLAFLQAFTNNFESVNIGNNPFLVKAYTEGAKKWEYPACYGYSWTIDWGGQTSTSDKNIFFVCVDEDVSVNAALTQDIHQIIPYDTCEDVTDASDLLTREDLMQILYIMAGSPDVDGLSTRFTDVPADDYYTDAIKWGEANHIAVGYPHQSFDTFGVGKYVRREDVCLMLMRYSELMGYKRAIDFGRSDDYLDYYDIDYEHWEALCWSSTWLIMEGRGGEQKDEQRIDPCGRATRSDIQYMINRMMEVNDKKEYTLPLNDNPEEVQSFVERFYRVILERDGEEKGVNYWTNSLIWKKRAGADVARGYIFSDEFINKGYPDDEFLEKMYLAFFDREPDKAGFMFWSDRMIDGYTREQVVAGFTESPEFKNLCARYGINPGTLGITLDYPLGTPTKLVFGPREGIDEEKVEAYVVRLYENALGRNADTEGVSYWKEAIITGKEPVSGTENVYDPASVIATGFLNSKEYLAKNKTDEDFLDDCYASFFGRKPDESGKEYWLDKLSKGYSRRRVILEGFGTSAEFKNLLKEYGFSIIEQ